MERRRLLGRRMVASGAALVTMAAMAGCTSNDRKAALTHGGDVVSNGLQHAEAKLDCSRTVVVDDKGKIVRAVDNGPRKIVYIGDHGGQHRTWAAATSVTFGEVVRTENGVLKDDYRTYGLTWVAQKDTGAPETTMYGTGIGPLPEHDDWARQISFPYIPDESGYIIHTLRETGSTEKVLTRMAPGTKKGGQMVVQHLGWITVECSNNPSQQSVVIVPPETKTVQN